jgi:release factor glutamine methyltransferase
MKSLKEILEKSTDFLNRKGISHPRRQAEELLADALDLKRLDLYLQFDRPLTDPEIEHCRNALQRRSTGEPVQYIRGKVEFLDCDIQVNSSVLIPRQETEILASKVVEDLKKSDQQGKILWDLCAGSGCLGISIKKKLPDLDVALSDLSSQALSVAKRNAQINAAEVSFVEGDLLEPFKGKKADYVVCNPPYISQGEYETLSKEVRDFEPSMALIADDEGLSFYKRLAAFLPQHLNPGGKVWLEIGYKQGHAVEKIFCSSHWKSCHFELDWSGNDRFFFLEIE